MMPESLRVVLPLGLKTVYSQKVGQTLTDDAGSVDYNMFGLESPRGKRRTLYTACVLFHRAAGIGPFIIPRPQQHQLPEADPAT
jgi:hypothetical protein